MNFSCFVPILAWMLQDELMLHILYSEIPLKHELMLRITSGIEHKKYIKTDGVLSPHDDYTIPQKSGWWWESNFHVEFSNTGCFMVSSCKSVSINPSSVWSISPFVYLAVCNILSTKVATGKDVSFLDELPLWYWWFPWRVQPSMISLPKYGYFMWFP